MRCAISLLVLAALVAAQEPATIKPTLIEKEVFLRPGHVDHVMEAPAQEVHLLFAFRFGLYSITEDGRIAPAMAGLKVEINDARRQPGYWNPLRPLAFDADVHDGWMAHDDDPGHFYVKSMTTEMIERRIVIRLPRTIMSTPCTTPFCAISPSASVSTTFF